MHFFQSTAEIGYFKSRINEYILRYDQFLVVSVQSQADGKQCSGAHHANSTSGLKIYQPAQKKIEKNELKCLRHEYYECL